MATMTATAAAKQPLLGRFAPVLEGLEGNIRDAGRAILQGRHAAEGAIRDTVLSVRRHSLRALAFAAGAGALAGCLVGFTLGRGRNTT